MAMKSRRIFICAERRFPRGDAGANRVQYLARALMLAGHEVIVVSIGQHRIEDYCKESKMFIYNAVKYINVPVRDGVFKRWDANIVSGFNTINILKNSGICSSDIVLIYTTNAIYGSILCNYCHEKIAATVVMDVVEKFQPFQYRLNQFDPRYLLFDYCFKNIYSRTGNVIVVSKHLEMHFNAKNLKVFRLPALIDPSEYQVNISASDGIVRMIYPGHIGKKEALGVMLEAFLMLSDSEKNRVEFHFTRSTKKELVEILGTQSYLLEHLCDIIHIHNWMSYDSLMDLYKKVDFLLFARSENEATLSNFPSKIPELLSCGIPPVSNRVGDFAEYLQDGIDSILFDKCTAEECCGAIRKALNLNFDELAELKKNARKCAEKQFDFRKWSDKVHNFLTNL